MEVLTGPPEFCDSVIAEKIADFSVFCRFHYFRGICKLPWNNRGICQNFTFLAIYLRKSSVNQHS